MSEFLESAWQLATALLAVSCWYVNGDLSLDASSLAVAVDRTVGNDETFIRD